MIMNTYFVNISSGISSSFEKKAIVWNNPECQYEFLFNDILSDNICKHLNCLNEESKLDVLGFDTKLLRLSAPIIAKSLSYLYNTSLKEGSVPSDWKLSKVTPVYKGKGDKCDKKNYRPIAVVCHIAKIFEKEVQSQLLLYLLNHDFINIDQHAFLPNHSTITCLHQVIDDWYEAFNEREMVGACFLDISKCFDSIDHELLLFKLSKYGILNNQLKWFTDYLSGRKQKVFCNGKTSSLKDMKIGIPQGSVLGPTLFLLFINDITTSLKSAVCSIFADDVLIYVSHKSLSYVTNKLQDSLNDLCSWYYHNRLKINADKTKVMLLKSSSSESLNIFIDNEQIILSK